MRTRLAAGEQVARMYQEPGLAWRERQAEVAETLVAERRATERHSSRVHPTPIAHASVGRIGISGQTGGHQRGARDDGCD
jgi:hypothetical protein